jgi:preprotein translocase subunit YajC
MGGRGVQGTVTAVTPGFYMVKTEDGETYKVNYSANTRILKQVILRQGEAGEKAEGGERGERGNRQRPAPEPIKSTDIKAGSDIAALGEVDTAARSVGAVLVMLIDPERARLMHEQRANYGKTWLAGKVTAINETTVSLTSALDNTVHAFQADENTTFRKHREPITLADIQVGDMVRVEGAMKGSTFIATSVAVMGMPSGGAPNVPHEAPPAPAAQPDAAQPK